MTNSSSECKISEMGRQCFRPQAASFRLCNVSSYATQLLEILSEDPALHVLFIPGNPGAVTFYKDFLESLYELLGGTVSMTASAIWHISHSRKDWEKGRHFSLQEQIDHRMIRQEMQEKEVPIVLVGYSIGSYMSTEMFQKSPEKVVYCIGLYPFLKLNSDAFQQSIIKKFAGSSITYAAVSSIVASLGFLPSSVSEFIVAKSLGKSWSRTAIEAPGSHLLKNMLFMAMTDFKEEQE